MGLDAPSFASLDSALDDIHAVLRKVYKTEAFGTLENSQIQTSSECQTVDHQPAIAMTTPAQQVGFQMKAQNHLANREQAMHVLQDIADYFQANEPHSPVSYMLQKTIKWSQMPLHEWLAQVIKDDQPLHMVQDILGVQPKNEYE